jgi:hypothetical protein
LMLPDHCKDVSFRDVDFELTEANIRAHAKGKKAYTRTDHMVLKHKEDIAIIRVFKENGKELFRPISSVEVIALPRDVVLERDEQVNVLNRSEMARVAMRHPGKWVVVQGLFNHLSFAKDAHNLELRVFDVVPPYPSKLSVLVEKALSAGMVDLPIVPVEETIDLNDLESRVVSEAVMFPCRASGLASRKRIHYLDETPELEGKVTLIGCDLSRRIFLSVYKRTPQNSIDMCPQELAPKDDSKRIIKCCKIKEGFVIQGNRAVVPWGATVQEVAAALNALFEHEAQA